MGSEAERAACFAGAWAAVSHSAPAQSASVPPAPVVQNAAPAAAQPVAAVAAPAPTPAPAVASAAGLGAEQVASRGTERSSQRDSVTGQIASLDTDQRGRLILHLDNGQIWRQTETEEFPINLDMSRAQPVEVTNSGFGGYRMNLQAIDRRIKVRRVQ